MNKVIDSEKKVEPYLVKEIKLLGGWALKISSMFFKGLPDRLILLPGGCIIFVELKTTNKKPSPAQKLVHRKLQNLGFRVEVIDSIELVQKLITELKNT